jgi:hypothetical protein
MFIHFISDQFQFCFKDACYHTVSHGYIIWSVVLAPNFADLLGPNAVRLYATRTLYIWIYRARPRSQLRRAAQSPILHRSANVNARVILGEASSREVKNMSARPTPIITLIDCGGDWCKSIYPIAFADNMLLRDQNHELKILLHILYEMRVVSHTTSDQMSWWPPLGSLVTSSAWVASSLRNISHPFFAFFGRSTMQVSSNPSSFYHVI